MSRILDALSALTRRLFSPAGPSARTAELHRAWVTEQLKEYSTAKLYAGPLDVDLNPTGETWEMRLAYRRALKEPAIKGPLLKKVYAVASLTPQVLPEDNDSPAEREAATWVDYAVSHSRGGWPRLLHDCCLHPLIEGFGVGEKVPKRIDRGRWRGRWGLEAVKFKETENLRFRLDEYRNVKSVRTFSAAQGGREFDPADFIIITHLSLWENPFGQSDLRAAYRACNLIEASIKLRAILLENFSGPFLVYKSSTTAARTEAERALSNARSRGWIRIDPNDDLNVVNLATSAPDQFQSTIEDLRKEAATAIAGAYLQMLESNSPQGDSETHKGVSELFEWWLAATVGAAITEQLVPDLHDPHYAADVGRPRVILGGIDPKEAEKAAARLTTAKSLGLPLKKSQVYELLELEVPEDADDTLGGEQQGGEGGLPGGPGPDDGGGGPAPDMGGPDGGEAAVPAELLAAMATAAEAEDWQAVDRLAALADDAEGLAAFVDGDTSPKMFADSSTRAVGDTWQGKGGRWYTKRRDGRVVPARNPNADPKPQRDPNAPKRDVIAEARAAKEAREPGRESARTRWRAALQDPKRVTADQLPALAAGLRELTRDELRQMGRELRQKVGGLKEDVVQRLLAHVGARGAGGPVKTSGQYGAWGAAAGGGAKPVSRDEFPKRGVGPGEKVEQEASKQVANKPTPQTGTDLDKSGEDMLRRLASGASPSMADVDHPRYAEISQAVENAREAVRDRLRAISQRFKEIADPQDDAGTHNDGLSAGHHIRNALNAAKAGKPLPNQGIHGDATGKLIPPGRGMAASEPTASVRKRAKQLAEDLGTPVIPVLVRGDNDEPIGWALLQSPVDIPTGGYNTVPAMGIDSGESRFDAMVKPKDFRNGMMLPFDPSVDNGTYAAASQILAKRGKQPDQSDTTPTITPAEFDRRMESIDPRDSGRVEVPEPARPLEADDADKERFDAAVERRDRMQAWAADRPDDLRAEEQVRRAEARVRDAVGEEGQPRPAGAPFTGTDAQGREWRNGVLVAKEEEKPQPAGRRRNFQTVRKQAAEGMSAGAAAMQQPHDGSALPEQPMYASLSPEQRADLDAQHRNAKTRQDARGVELRAQRLAAEAESNRRADAARAPQAKPMDPETSIRHHLDELRTEKHHVTNLVPLADLAAAAGVSLAEAQRYADRLEQAGEGRYVEDDGGGFFRPGQSFRPPPDSARPARAPTPPEADVRAAVSDYLKTGPKQSGMTSIPALRRHIAETFGPAAASQRFLNGVLNRMDLAGDVRMVETDDRSQHTPEELAGGVAASSGQLMYLKPGKS